MILCSLLGEALDPSWRISQFPHDVWKKEQGLPQNSVNAMVQTRDGYLWLGTQEGLVRFDGVRFTVFDKHNTPVLKHNYVWTLLEDSKGDLWIGTYGGGLTVLHHGAFRTYTRSDGLSSEIIRSLAEDKDGSVWIGTEEGLNHFKDGKFTVLNTRNSGLSNNVVRALAWDPGGDLWVGTYGGGLNRLSQGKFTRYNTGNGLTQDIVYAIVTDHDNALWIGTDAGLCRLKDGKTTVFRTEDGLPMNVIRCLWLDRDDGLWVGTYGDGLSRYYNGKFENYPVSAGLSNEFVRSLFEDREGSIWIGTESGGLNRLKYGKFVNYSTSEGLSQNSVWSVLQDKDGAIWAGTDGGGLNRFKDGKFTAYTTKDGLALNNVFSLGLDPGGDLWIGTWGNGIQIYRNGFKEAYTVKNGLANNSVTSFCPRKAGGMWIGTDGGLSLLDHGSFQNFTTRNGLPNDGIFTVYEDTRGTLWIGSNGGGLASFRDGKFSSYTTKNGLSHDLVTAIYEDRDGTLWVGTWGGGLNRLRNGAITRYTTHDGLYDDVVYVILEDDLGNLWMSCNKGVFSVSTQELNAFAEGKARSIVSRHFDQFDGMVSEESNGTVQPVGWKDTSGRLWFATTGGLAVLDPARIKVNPLPPPVMIEQLLVNNVLQPLRDSIQLKPGQGNLEIHYTGLSYLYPEKVFFKYKLEGFDEDWVDAGPRRVAFYTNLPHGEYRFLVMACNNDGVWNDSPAVLALMILPRFYEKRNIQVFFGLLFLMTFLLVYFRRTGSMKRQQLELQRLVAERTEDLRKANELLQQLSIQDGLTGVANRRRFDEILDLEWRRAARLKTPLAMLLIDVDFFKAYNDSKGHQAGDECLKQIAAALQHSHRRAGDLVARYGGEEFAVVIPACDSAGALKAAEHLRTQIQDLRIPHPASSIADVVTISIGAASFQPAKDRTAADLLAAADRSLYVAKSSGRNLTIISTP